MAGYAASELPVWLQTTLGRWATFGGGGYSLNRGSGNRNNWLAGWAALYRVREGLQLGGELFARTADAEDASSSSSFNLGGVWELTPSTRLLFSAAYCGAMRRRRIRVRFSGRADDLLMCGIFTL